jgi:hypothetical protein
MKHFKGGAGYKSLGTSAIDTLLLLMEIMSAINLRT